MGAIKLTGDKSNVLKIAEESANETASTVQAFNENTQETTKSVWRTMRAFGEAAKDVVNGVWRPVHGWFKECARRFDDFQNLR